MALHLPDSGNEHPLLVTDLDSHLQEADMNHSSKDKSGLPDISSRQEQPAGRGEVAGFPWQLAYVVAVIALGMIAILLSLFGVF